MSAAHRVLSIYELAYEILRLADTSNNRAWTFSESGPKPPAWRNAALSCKTLLEPALDLLWEDSQVAPIVKVFKVTVVDVLGVSLDTGDDTFPSFAQEDLSRFRVYSSRVRIIRPVISGAAVSTSFLFLRKALSTASPRASFFPRLQAVLCDATKIMTPGLEFFLVPSVRTIEVGRSVSVDNGLLRPWLSSLPPFVPNLARLKLAVLAIPIETLALLTSLTSLDIEVPDQAENSSALADINKLIDVLSKLQEVRVTKGRTFVEAGSTVGHGFTQASSLDMRVSSESWRSLDIVDLIRKFPATSLDSVYIHVLGAPRYPHQEGSHPWRDIAQTLRTKYAKSLKRFTFILGPGLLARSTEPAIVRRFIESLLHMHELRQLSISVEVVRNQFDLNDADLDAMAAAWPCLTHLTLSGGLTPNHQYLFSPRSLARLASHCPLLRDISLSLDVNGLALSDEDMAVALPCHGLQWLEPFDHVIPSDGTRKPAELASFIHRIFPHARIREPEGASIMHRKFWRQVQQLVETMPLLLPGEEM